MDRKDHRTPSTQEVRTQVEVQEPSHFLSSNILRLIESDVTKTQTTGILCPENLFSFLSDVTRWPRPSANQQNQDGVLLTECIVVLARVVPPVDLLLCLLV